MDIIKYKNYFKDEYKKENKELINKSLDDLSLEEKYNMILEEFLDSTFVIERMNEKERSIVQKLYDLENLLEYKHSDIKSEIEDIIDYIIEE